MSPDHFLSAEYYLERFANARISIRLPIGSSYWELHHSSLLESNPSPFPPPPPSFNTEQRFALRTLERMLGGEMTHESAEWSPWAAVSREIDLC